jgi:FkbH-like protein
VSRRLVLLSDFDVRNFGLALRAAGGAVAVDAGDYGQVSQHLLAGDDPLWTLPCDAVVVWTTPGHASPTFQAALAGHEWNPDDLVRDVDAYVELVARAIPRAAAVLVPTWTVDPRARHRGLVSTRTGAGVHNALARMNLRLMEAAEKRTGVFVLPADGWLVAGGANAFSPKHWYLAKSPFGLDVYKAAAADVLGAVATLRGGTKKLLILDLDDTLWGGVLGEEGIEGLRLGGHDPIGEAYVDFQRALEALGRSGVLLAIASKNDEALALEALDRHPEMVLRRSSFAAWRVNWDDKAANIVAIADELSLGLADVVFIDDSPAERDRVRRALPEVIVPEWPSDVLTYAPTLRGLRLFDTASISDEDRQRAGHFSAERSRRGMLVDLGSVEDWVRSLEVMVRIAPLDRTSLARTAQLVNKTNQMNLATRRMSAPELMAWSETPGHALLTVRAADRLGDYGLVGVIGIHFEGAAAEVVDFILSCRAMGRGVEEAMVRSALDLARRRGAARLVARYLKTERNGACLKKLMALAHSTDADADGEGHGPTFIWDAAVDLPPFGGIAISVTGIEADAGA